MEATKDSSSATKRLPRMHTRFYQMPTNYSMLRDIKSNESLLSGMTSYRKPSFSKRCGSFKNMSAKANKCMAFFIILNSFHLKGFPLINVESYVV